MIGFGRAAQVVVELNRHHRKYAAAINLVTIYISGTYGQSNAADGCFDKYDTTNPFVRLKPRLFKSSLTIV